MANPTRQLLELDGIEVAITNPDKVYFPTAGITKRELVDYYLAVVEPVLRGVARRPMVLKRYVNGVAAEPFFQKRAPAHRPPWLATATFHYPSGRSAEELVVDRAAQLAYVINLGCVDLNPHAVRADDLDHPDELRIDLDPMPGSTWSDVLAVAAVVEQVLADHHLIGWPKTSGSRGVHIWVRIERRWSFAEVRRAAHALAREVERRAPAIATAKWWKEERHGVFVDYNQNARDRTMASAYSVRPTADARVSMPLSWDELATADPAAYSLRTVPDLVATRGDAHAAIDHPTNTGSLDSLLALADELGDPEPSRKRAKPPVITIAQAKHKDDALAGLERWKARYPEIVALLAPEHILIDTNRGRATAWYRVRINLVGVPQQLRPPPAPPDPDYDWKTEWREG